MDNEELRLKHGPGFALFGAGLVALVAVCSDFVPWPSWTRVLLALFTGMVYQDSYRCKSQDPTRPIYKQVTISALKALPFLYLAFALMSFERPATIISCCYWVLWKIPNEFAAYLKVDGPLGEELKRFVILKYIVIVFVMTAIVLTHFGTIVASWPGRLIGIVLMPGFLSTLRTSSFMSWWAKKKLSHAVYQSIDEVAWAMAILPYVLLVYGLDKLDLLEAFILHWAPRVAGLPLEWIERRFIADETQFQYKSLTHPREIRLLIIEKRSLFSGLLRCRLEHSDVDRITAYEALSYHWQGSQTSSDAKEILVDGKLFRPTTSAYALLYARSSIWTSRVLWMDSVCIQQDNREELSHQVKLMGEIYARAERVVVWPGGDYDSMLASAMVFQMYETYLAYKGPADAFEDWYSNQRQGARWHQHSPRWQALVKLFRNPYWLRTWVAQEIALGSNVQVYHGGLYIPWDTFKTVMLSCWHPHRRSCARYDLQYFQTPGNENHSNNASVVRFLHEYNKRDENSVPLDLGSILSLSVNFKASRPEDKIFGIIGLVAAASINLDPLLEIDYERSLTDIYSGAARHILSQDRNPLGVLPYAGIGYASLDGETVHTPGLAAMPSWAPDWSRERTGCALASPVELTGSYRSATQIKADVQFRQEGQNTAMVGIKAISVDTIRTMGPPLSLASVKHDCPVIFQWLQEAQKLTMQYAKNPYGPKCSSSYEACWRTVIGDRNQYKSRRPTPAKNETYYRGVLHALGSCAGGHDNIATRFPNREKEFIDGMFDIATSFMECSLGRRFCVTDTGCVGLVPPFTEEGDLVCIILGAQTPYLLRSCNNGSQHHSPSASFYQLVGECYIHGLMDGVDGLGRNFEGLQQEVFWVI